MNLRRERVAALRLPVLIGQCRSTLASYVVNETIRGNIPLQRYALHYMIMGCELYHINCVERKGRSKLLIWYCINYGNFYYSQSKTLHQEKTGKILRWLKCHLMWLITVISFS